MFVVVHAWLGFIGLTAPTLPWGDVIVVYNTWIQNAFEGYWVGINGPWVYPILALLPMLAARLFGQDLYGLGWLALTCCANAAVFAFLLYARSVKRYSSAELRCAAAWWWLAFLLLLGPVALGRIDTFTVAFVIIGLLIALAHPAIAGIFLAIATWIKVWPITLAIAVIITIKRRFRFAVAAATTAVTVLAVGLALGAGANIFSFVSQQTSRGLQVEAPVSTVWMWLAFFRLPGSKVYYESDILTFQVKGVGAELADFLTTPLLACAMLLLFLLGLYVMRTGASVQRVLPSLSLALVTALILFNKVGSPQFMLWLSAPLIAGILWQGKKFLPLAVIAGVLAALTQLIYPYLYDWLLSLEPWMLGVLTIRNLGECLLFVLAVRSLWRARQHAQPAVVGAIP